MTQTDAEMRDSEWIKENLLHTEDRQAVEQVVQRGCVVFILRDFKTRLGKVLSSLV